MTVAERIAAWFRRPYDRCQVGNHRMGTKGGYTECRKHQMKPWVRLFKEDY